MKFGAASSLSAALLLFLFGASSPADAGKPAKAAHALWRLDGTWLAHNIASGEISVVSFPAPYNATAAAISTDGEVVVFTSASEGFNGTGLFLLRRSTGRVQKIGYDIGEHTDPFVAADNGTVYFSYHPGYNTTESHAKQKKWAQIHKVSLDGGQRTAVTSTKGCHLSPGGVSGDRAYFVFSPCDGTRHLSFVTLSTGEESKVPVGGNLRALVVGPSGLELLLVVEMARTTTVSRYNTRTKQSAVVATFERPIDVRASFGVDANTIFIQSGNSVWRHARSGPPVQISLPEVK